jgi:hypothetical protein
MSAERVDSEDATNEPSLPPLDWHGFPLPDEEDAEVADAPAGSRETGPGEDAPSGQPLSANLGSIAAAATLDRGAARAPRPAPAPSAPPEAGTAPLPEPSATAQHATAAGGAIGVTAAQSATAATTVDTAAGQAMVTAYRPGSVNPIFQGSLGPNDTVTLIDSTGRPAGVGRFVDQGRALRVTAPDGTVQTIDLAGATVEQTAQGTTRALTVATPAGTASPSGGAQTVRTLAATGAAETAGTAISTQATMSIAAAANPAALLGTIVAGGKTVAGTAATVAAGASDPIVTLPDGSTMPESQALAVLPNAPGDPLVVVPGAGGTSQVMTRSQWLGTGPVVATPDGPMTANQFFFAHPGASPADFVQFTQGGTTYLMTQGQWRLFGAVGTPDGWMNPAVYFAGHPDANPSDYIVLDDNGTKQLMTFSAWQASSPAMTPDGYENPGYYLYVHGGTADDYYFYTQNGQTYMVPKTAYSEITMPDGSTFIVNNAEFAQQGPTVTTPDGQTVTWGQWLLEHQGDGPASDPWMLMTDTNGTTLVVKQDALVADIQTLSTLGDRMYGSGTDVSSSKSQLESDLGGIDINRAFTAISFTSPVDQVGTTIDNFNPFSAGPPGWGNAVAALQKVQSSLDGIRANHDAVMTSLLNFGDGLYEAMEAFWQTEQANAQMLGLDAQYPGQDSAPTGKHPRNYS